MESSSRYGTRPFFPYTSEVEVMITRVPGCAARKSPAVPLMFVSSVLTELRMTARTLYNRREMKYQAASAERLVQRVRVSYRTRDAGKIPVRGQPVQVSGASRREIIEDNHFPAFREAPLCKVRSDEPRAARDQNTHGRSVSSCRITNHPAIRNTASIVIAGEKRPQFRRFCD